MRTALAFTLLCGALALAACEQQSPDTDLAGPPEGSAPSETAGIAPPTPPPAPSTGAAGDAAVEEPPAPIPEAEKGEAGARNVLQTWARALERKDFARAWSLFGDHRQRSGVSAAQYAARFDDYATIAVATSAGRIEGAAGSLYYAVPVAISGTTKAGAPYTLRGPVVLRRANDVPGASAEQLRWHIESAELKPVN